VDEVISTVDCSSYGVLRFKVIFKNNVTSVMISTFFLQAACLFSIPAPSEVRKKIKLGYLGSFPLQRYI